MICYEREEMRNEFRSDFWQFSFDENWSEREMKIARPAKIILRVISREWLSKKRKKKIKYFQCCLGGGEIEVTWMMTMTSNKRTKKNDWRVKEDSICSFSAINDLQFLLDFQDFNFSFTSKEISLFVQNLTYLNRTLNNLMPSPASSNDLSIRVICAY